MKLKYNNQEIDFNIPQNYKKIAVNCSGGADSAILLYMVIKYLIDNSRLDVEVNVLTCSNNFKHRWNGRKAADVINYILDKTKFNNFNMHYTYYRDVQDLKYFNEIEYSMFDNNQVDLIISGLTSNPQEIAIVTDINGKSVNISKTALPDRSVEKNPWTVSNNKSWYIPLANVDKKFISFLYTYFNVNDLFDLTRSCEAVPDLEFGFNPDFEKLPCGTCWWCLERKWAFGRF